MKALVLDNRDQYPGKACMHAFVIGVSAYRNLPPAEDQRELTGAPTLGMKQLSSSALAAYKVYSWLANPTTQLHLPLATCRLLLSPSQAELEIEPKLNGFAEAATVDAFEQAVNDWRNDAQSHPNAVTFFYFVGHGVQRGRGDHVMLLEGFGQIGKTLLHHGIDTTQLIGGMAPFPSQEKIAHTQLYFIDACRITPAEFSAYDNLPTYGLWDTPKLSTDDRIAPVFYTTVPGRAAFAIKGSGTTFSTALLECLAGGGAVESNDFDPEWRITINSLNEALEYHLEKVNKKEGTNQAFQVQGVGRNVVINRLTSPPDVDVELRIVPSAAKTVTKVKLIDDDDKAVWEPHVPTDPYPFERRVPAGNYRLGAKIDPVTPPYSDRKHKSIRVAPPVQKLKVEVA